VSADNNTALTLLNDVPSLEADWLVFLAGTETAGKLKPIDWASAGIAVWLPFWQDTLKPHVEDLRSLTLGGLPAVAQQPLATLKVLREQPGETGEEKIRKARYILGSAAAVTLSKVGWQIRALPGEEIVLERDGRRLAPYAVVRPGDEAKSAAEEWHRVCAEAGVADLTMSPSS
jgi:hypothetical protein